MIVVDDGFFRKKSVEKIASPEQLTDYIRVTNPGVWLLLAAVVALLCGVCVWGVFGHMDTKLTVAVVSDNGASVCYVKEADIASVKPGTEVLCGEMAYIIEQISAEPVAMDETVSEYALHVGDLKTGEWAYIATLDGTLADGVYPAEIITDSVSPMSFVFN